MQSTRPDLPLSTMPCNDRPAVIQGLTIFVLITAMHTALVFALSSVHAISKEMTSGARMMKSVFVMEMGGSVQPAWETSSEETISLNQPDPVAIPSLLPTSAQNSDDADARLPQMEPRPTRTETKPIIKKSAVSQAKHAEQRSISDNPSSIPAAISAAPGGTGDVTPPTTRAAYLNNPHPPYPRASRRLREEGQVLLAVEIDINGHASQAVIKRSSGFDRLDQSALQTVLKWRFIPGQQAGIAKKMWVNIPINFVLE